MTRFKYYSNYLACLLGTLIAFAYRLHIGAGLAALEGLRLALSVLSSHVCPPFKK